MGTTWTIAIRPNAQRGIFHRVAGIDLTWHQACDLGTFVARQMPDAAVWTVPTQASEQDAAAHSPAHAADVANVLVATGRRIRIAEDGVLPFAIRPTGEDLRYSEKSALRQVFEYGAVYYTSIVRTHTVRELIRRGLVVRNPAVTAERAYLPHSMRHVQLTPAGMEVMEGLLPAGAVAEFLGEIHHAAALEAAAVEANPYRSQWIHSRPLFEVVGELTAEQALSLPE